MSAAVDKLESDALRSPLTVRGWVHLLRAIDAQNNDAGIHATSAQQQQQNGLSEALQGLNRLNEVFERSLLHNPYSYKLWMTYLNHRIAQWATVASLAQVDDKSDGGVQAPHVRIWNGIIKVFERALQKLPNMPLLWAKYVEFVSLCDGIPPQQQAAFPVMYTKVRAAIVDALHALPVTQHTVIWNVFRKWSATLRLDTAPFTSLNSLWELLLQGNTSDRVMGEYVQFLVKCQRNEHLLRYLCTLGRQASTSAKWTLPKLCQDSVLWDLVGGVLLAPPTRSSSSNVTLPEEPVNIDALSRLVTEGKSYALQPDRLVLSLAIYVMRRGQFHSARTILSDVVQSTANAVTFQDAFAALVRMEEQLVDCVALDDNVAQKFATDEDFLAFMRAKVFRPSNGLQASSESSPLFHLTTLVQDYPLLLNAVQLRQRPHDPRLWLKRVECLYERAAERGSQIDDPLTTKEVEEVLRQGITLCKHNHVYEHHADGGSTTQQMLHDVSALYLAWADLMVSGGRYDEALDLLKKATFTATFKTLDANTLLFGRMVEVLCLRHGATTPPPSDDAFKSSVLDSLMSIIRTELNQWAEWRQERVVGGGAGHSSRRVTANSMFLGQRGATGGVAAKVLSSPGIWATAWDIVFWAEGVVGKRGEELVRWMSNLGLYTPSIALDRAARLQSQSMHLDAYLVLEDALSRVKTSGPGGAVATLALAEAAAATVVDHLQTMFDGEPASTPVEPHHHEAVPRGHRAPSLLRIQAQGTLMLHQVPSAGMPSVNTALFTEKLRGTLRQGLAAARDVALAAEHHPHQALTFYFCAAACEESIGLYGNCITTLQDATRSFYLRMKQHMKSTAATQRVGELSSMEESDTRQHEDWFLKCVEALGRKLKQLRGADVFYTEMAAMLKWAMSPRCQAELAMRLTAELAKAHLVDKCRAVFIAVSPHQNPAAAQGNNSGELFWGAWATFERDYGNEVTFTSSQRTKRNVLDSFSKSEVKFEQQ